MAKGSNNGITKHFMIIGGGTMINMLIGLLSTPIITRIVDPTEYGQFSIFTLYATIAEMVLCLGLDQALVRYYYERDDLEYKRSLLYRCVAPPVIASVVVACIYLLLVSLHIFDFEFSIGISVWLSICVLLQVVYRFSLLTLRLDYKSKKYSLFNILRKALYLGFFLILALICKGNYLLVLSISTVLSVGFCCVVSIISEKELWKFGCESVIQFPFSEKEIIKYALPFIVTMGVTQLFQALDKIALNMYRSYAEVGIYSSTMTLVHVFALIQTTFNALWSPMQVEHYTNNPDDHSFYQKGNQIITVIMFFIGTSLILVKDVFAYLLGSKYREAAFILPFLIFNPIMYTISETTYGGLVFKKKSNVQVLVAVGACLTNFIGNTILVPRIGCQGAAISTGLSYIVFFTLRTVLGNHYYYTDFKLKRFYFITFVTCLYAFYNSFHRIDLICILGYIACVGILVFLYRDTVIWGIKYLKHNSKKLLNKILHRKNNSYHN